MDQVLIARIADNLKRVEERVQQAAARAGRTAGDVTIIGVTKRKPPEVMRAAYQAGIRHFGENQMQEALKKFPQVDLESITRHFIGHLQRNKAKYLPRWFDVLHSLDSKELANKLQRVYAAEGRRLPVLIQVNISGQTSHYGVEPAAVSDFVGYCLEQSALEVVGLMGIGPHVDEHDRIRVAFRELFRLGEELKRAYGSRLPQLWLSMGMSGDFEIAIEEGATHIRLGQVLFGPRKED